MHSDLMPIIEGFPRPDWEKISNSIFESPEADWNQQWCITAQNWVRLIAEKAGKKYRVSESDNFLVLSQESDRKVSLLQNHMERTLRQILKLLPGIASDEGYGNHVVLVFSDQNEYYEYISYFYPEGDFALSGGVYLNVGYGHFVFPYLNINDSEFVIAHELTHACLSHLPLPLWLDEGLAVTIESELCGWQALSIDNEQLERHREFWNQETVQEFWSGKSFQRQDEGSELSYELARYCVRSLSHDLGKFSDFVNLANYSDAGENAAEEHFGGSLGALMEQFWGQGKWTPNPDSWSTGS